MPTNTGKSSTPSRQGKPDMPKPITLEERSNTEIILHKKGSRALYVKEGKSNKYHFKEVLRFGRCGTFPLVITKK